MTRPVVADAVTVTVVQAAPDTMVPYPFTELGITETAAARMLAARVPLVRLGRRRYARRSALLDALDALGQEQAHAKPAAEPKTEDGYGALVDLASRRGGR